jgi:hypothetical protein
METLSKQISNQQARASLSPIGAELGDGDGDNDDETNKVVHFASHAEVKIDPQAGHNYAYADTVMEAGDVDVDAIKAHQQTQEQGSLDEPETPSAPPAPLQENESSQFTMCAEVVTGLTEPMNPFLRRRREFLEGTAKSSFRLPRIRHDQGKRNLMERPQYRLTSRTVRTYKWNEQPRQNKIKEWKGFPSILS